MFTGPSPDTAVKTAFLEVSSSGNKAPLKKHFGGASVATRAKRESGLRWAAY